MKIYLVTNCEHYYIMAITPFKVIQGHRFWYQLRRSMFVTCSIAVQKASSRHGVMMLWACVTFLMVCRLISPCDECAAPYGFRNQLNLTEDTAKFRVNIAVFIYVCCGVTTVVMHLDCAFCVVLYRIVLSWPMVTGGGWTHSDLGQSWRSWGRFWRHHASNCVQGK